MPRALWTDEAGAILSIELILIGTVLGIGGISAYTTLRDAIITELASVSTAASVDQSFSLRGRTLGSAGTADSTYTNGQEFSPSSGAATCVVVANLGETVRPLLSTSSQE